MRDIVYLNGQFVDASEARVSIFDGGFLHGTGLFETLRAEHGRVFQWDAHVGRLLRSAESLELMIRREDIPPRHMVESLLERNGLQSARLRMTVTVGDATRSVAASAPQATPASSPVMDDPEMKRPTPTVCITADTLTAYPPELYERGMSVIISRRLQSATDPLVGHKTICYLPRLLALREAQRARCGEAIFFDEDHHLAEGAISNVFLVRKESVLTPPLSTPVLPGTARALVLRLAGELGLSVGDEDPLTINDLLDADEVFLTNALMQVMPVCRVEKRDIGCGRTGPITRRLYEAYRVAISEECGGDLNGRGGEPATGNGKR